MKYVQIITTTDKKNTATKIARTLVTKRLAACVQVFPISSTFSWNEKVMAASELLLLIKAKSSNYKAIEREIKSMHNYVLPEIIAIPITKGSEKYLKWIAEETK